MLKHLFFSVIAGLITVALTFFITADVDVMSWEPIERFFFVVLILYVMAVAFAVSKTSE